MKMMVGNSVSGISSRAMERSSLWLFLDNVGGSLRRCRRKVAVVIFDKPSTISKGHTPRRMVEVLTRGTHHDGNDDFTACSCWFWIRN